MLARAALDDGDVTSARQALASAATFPHGREVTAELAYLDALLLRAEGALSCEVIGRVIWAGRKVS